MTIQDFNEALRQENSVEFRVLGKLKGERALSLLAEDTTAFPWDPWSP